VSLIVQSILGNAEISWDGESSKHRSQYFQEVAKIFRSINILIRCIIDCQIVLGDSVTIQNAMMLERSLGSKAWDDSPMQMIQIPEIGNVAVRKLVNAGIRSIEDLEATDARRIETVVGKNPPFGLRILDALKAYPKLRVSLHVQQASVSVTTNAKYTPTDQMERSPRPQMASESMLVQTLASSTNGPRRGLAIN
jgi:ATP-dependent DNA helicase HFM1/MER3